MEKVIKILIIDDHDLVRKGTQMVLQELGTVLTFEAATGSQANEVINLNADLDLILLDISLPDINGLNLLRSIRISNPLIRVVMLSGTDNPLVIEYAAKEGARGFICKGSHDGTLLKTIQCVLTGAFCFPTSLSPDHPPDQNKKKFNNNVFLSAKKRRADDCINKDSYTALPSLETLERRQQPQKKNILKLDHKSGRAGEIALTPRQHEVLILLTQGSPSKIIAEQLGCTEPTVRVHISAIFKALGVSNRTEATIKAQLEGLVETKKPAIIKAVNPD